MKSRGKIAVDSVGQGRPRTQNADRQSPKSRRPCCGLQPLRWGREPDTNRMHESPAELLSDDTNKYDEAEWDLLTRKEADVCRDNTHTPQYTHDS